MTEKRRIQMPMEFYDILVKRLQSKKAELKERQEQFIIVCENEMNSNTFERNAINELIIMQSLKSEIAELDFMQKCMDR